MLNNEIADTLIKKYGNDSFMIYCRMEHTRNELESEEFKKLYPAELNEFDYEVDWWVNKYFELLNKKNH